MVDRLKRKKKSQTELSDLYNLCSDGLKNNEENKNIDSHTLTIKISMKIVLIWLPRFSTAQYM